MAEINAIDVQHDSGHTSGFLSGPVLLLWAASMAGGALIGWGAAIAEPLGWLPGIFLVVATLVFARVLIRSGERWLDELVCFASALENGDLTYRFANMDGRLAPYGERLNAMARSLVRIVLAFARSSHELTSVASESTANAAGGDEGVRMQRDITVSSAASLEELTVSLQMASEQAGDAAGVAEATRRVAAAGAEQVSHLAANVSDLASTVADSATTAARLGERSGEIGAIVEVIKGISGQTNLLALNAAIEAARAGEQGRGFSVVADEVRKLAERTGQAAGEIGGLIAGIREEITAMVLAMEASNQRASESAAEAGQAAQALGEVTGNTLRTLELVRDIAAASAEQSIASQSIARDIEQVAQLADRNETLVRESSDLSRYVEQLAAQLASTLHSYRYE